eukprot:scaffold7636_cov126-Skeletonema_dohrnii-CCMP3373.AAC.5
MIAHPYIYVNVRQEFGQLFYWQCRGGQKALVKLFSQPCARAPKQHPTKLVLFSYHFSYNDIVKGTGDRRRFVGIDLFTFLAGANA